MMVRFFVDGEPRAKQSFRVGSHGGYQPARIKAWQEDVAWNAQQAMRRLELMEPMEGSLTVELIFFLGNARRIDSDNLSKAVQDGLNGIVWKDDQQNIRLVIDKYICREKQGVLVIVKTTDRQVEISRDQMMDMVSLSRYGLKPAYAEVA
jgi:Holliday junction resolvase RusA-like endonuclease